jgi:5-methylcytosine-specific restriction endonuclease McrA
MEALTSSDAKRRWRKAIKEAWNNECCFCGCPPIDNKSLTIDHLKPRSKGGESTSKNCLPACAPHNRSKGSEEWKEWYRKQPFYAPEREARILFWLDHSRLPSQEELLERLRRMGAASVAE